MQLVRWPVTAGHLYTKIGSGTIPIADILALLKENGYRGFYSLEWEGKWREELREELRGEGFEPEKAIEDYVLMMKHLFFRSES